jgi:hypothetical protein
VLLLGAIVALFGPLSRRRSSISSTASTQYLIERPRAGEIALARAWFFSSSGPPLLKTHAKLVSRGCRFRSVPNDYLCQEQKWRVETANTKGEQRCEP